MKTTKQKVRALYDKTTRAFDHSTVDYPDRVNAGLMEVYAYGRRNGHDKDQHAYAVESARIEKEAGEIHLQERIKAEDERDRLRAALEFLYEQVCSLEDVTLTRDIEKHKAETIFDDAVEQARKALL